MTGDNSVERAFDDRVRSIRQGLDLDAGLDRVRQRNSATHRAVRAGAGFVAALVVIGATVFGVSGGSDGDVSVVADGPIDRSRTAVSDDTLPAQDSGTSAVVPPPTPTPTTTLATTLATTLPAASDPSGATDSSKRFSIDPALWRVTNVASDDVLNVRIQPSARASRVGKLAPDATGVRATGAAARIDGGATWYEIRLPSDPTQFGWANAAYLTLQPPSTGTSFADLACAVSTDMLDGAEQTGATVLVAGQADSSAPTTGVELLSIEADRGPVDGLGDRACERTVLTFDTDTIGQVRGVTGDGEVRIDLPMVTSSVQTEHIDAGVYVVRGTDGGMLYADFPATAGVLRLSVLDQPARIVVDHVERSPTDGPVTSPALIWQDLVVNALSGDDPDRRTRPVTTPITVSGYARPFEANLTATILDSSGLPVAGPVIDGPAVFPGSPEFGVGTSDWIEAWGEFTFTIDGLPAEEYVLMLATGWDDQTEEYLWREIPFTVSS